VTVTFDLSSLPQDPYEDRSGAAYLGAWDRCVAILGSEFSSSGVEMSLNVIAHFPVDPSNFAGVYRTPHPDYDNEIIYGPRPEDAIDGLQYFRRGRRPAFPTNRA